MNKSKVCEIKQWQKISNYSDSKLMVVQEDLAISKVQVIENIPLVYDSSESCGENNKNKKTTSLLDSACRQLRKYLSGQRENFSLSLKPRGTSFQLKVWQELRKIPYGETRSYKQISENISAGSPRAVGGACGQNPILIFIPCHRVIRTDGSPGGFGAGREVKKKLLELEGCKL